MATRYFNYIADKIASAKSKADTLASNIGHHGIEGEIRELAIKECIMPFLTHSFHCGTGKIIDSYQNISDQIDLGIYHRKTVPPIFVTSDLGLFPVESVRYAFEVKSKLTAKGLKDAIKKYKSIERLKPYPQGPENPAIPNVGCPTNVLFAFDSDISGSEIERYIKYDPGTPPICQVLCVLGKGYWAFAGVKHTWNGLESKNEGAKYIEFCSFITGLMNTLADEEWLIAPFKPGVYVNIESA